MSRRNEEKKRRRLKRQKKRQRPERSIDDSHDLPEPPEAFAFLRTLKQLFDLPRPARWPGVSDRALARPDLVKLDLAEWASREEPGKGKLRRLETGFQSGLLGFLPDMEHWAMEEFFWHGCPGDSWHPIDAFLAAQRERYPPAAREQILRWKEARPALFEIGTVRDDLAELREWDAYAGTAVGPWLRVIALNIGGVNFYRKHEGQLTLTYVAPWAPAEQLHCAMGYGSVFGAPDVNLILPLVGLRYPEIICRPLPWKTSPSALEEHMRHWRSREWHRWLEERLQFPFAALVAFPSGPPRLRTVVRLLPSTPEEARNFGIYFDVPLEDGVMAAIGATGVTPLDVQAPNLAALREYSAYRERVGPPPGVAGQPSFFGIK